MMKAMVSIFLVLAMAGFASAAEPAHRHASSPVMKQHQVMGEMNRHWESYKKDLAAGDLTAAEKALGDLRNTSAHLDQFTPHKNKGRKEEFKRQSDSFKENLTRLEDAIRGQNTEVMKHLSKTIDAACVQCHKGFK